MGLGLSTCSLDGAVPTAELRQPPAYKTSARSSQMLCESASRSGKYVCAAVGCQTLLYSTATGRKVESLDGHSGPVTAMCSAGRWLCTASVDKTIICWDMNSFRQVARMQGHTGPIWCLAVLGDSMVFSGADDGTVAKWDTTSGRRVGALSSHASPVRCMLVMEDRFLWSGSENGMLVASDLVTQAPLSTARAHKAAVTCLLATVAGTEAFYSGSADGFVKRWDPLSGTCLASFEAHSDWVTCLLFAEDALFTGSRDRTIRRWDPATGTLEATFDQGTISFKQRKGFLAAMDDGSVSICKSTEGEKFAKVDHADGSVSLRTHNGHYLSVSEAGAVTASASAVGADEVFHLLDNGDGSLTIRSAHGSYVRAQPDGAAGAASAVPDRDPEESEKFAHCWIEGHYSGVMCLLDVSGALMSASADRCVKLWDPSTGLLLASLEGRTGATCLLEAGGCLYAAAARGTPLRLPKPRPSLVRPSSPAALGRSPKYEEARGPGDGPTEDLADASGRSGRSAN